MKEKLKKIFLNKNLWCSILETFCAVLIFIIGYFSGFSSGLLVDDTIRTELIEKAFDETKNEKLDIHFDRKESIEPTYQDFNIIQPILNFTTTDSRTISACVNFRYRVFYSLDSSNFNNIFIDINSVNINYSFYYTIYNLNILSSIVEEIVPLNNLTDSFILDFSNLTTFNYFDTLEFSYPYFTYLNDEENFAFNVSIFFNGNLTLSQYSLNAANNFTSSIEEIINTIYNLYDIEEFSPNIFDLYNNTIYVPRFPFNNQLAINFYNDGFELGLENGGFSGEDLQNAYDSGFQDGKSEGYQEGLEKGVQAGLDGANNSDSVFDRVFMVIRNAGASILNLFDFYIFPNMPFYVVIAIPFIIGSLFILFKILIK